jgi:hypothetical protein
VIGAMLIWGLLIALIFGVVWAVGEAKESNRARVAVNREERRARERARRKTVR